MRNMVNSNPRSGTALAETATPGPVVRINPYELHVNVPGFYDTLYASAASGRRTEKWTWSAKMFGTTQAAVGTASHELHRVRRAALNPFFSRRSVVRLEPVIQLHVDKLRARLERSADSGEPVNLTDAFTALSADVIGDFAFGKRYGFLDADDFNPGWHKLMLVSSADDWEELHAYTLPPLGS